MQGIHRFCWYGIFIELIKQILLMLYNDILWHIFRNQCEIDNPFIVGIKHLKEQDVWLRPLIKYS